MVRRIRAYPYKNYIHDHAPVNRVQVRSLNFSIVDTSKCSSVQQAVIELWLLSKCQHLILTTLSSFGWMISGISGIHPTIVSDLSCHIQPFSRPCYYELTHVKQLSCFNHKTMLANDGCCQSENFCQSNCLHHDPKGGAHFFYFLLVWPTIALVKWLMKWVIILFIFIFLLLKVTRVMNMNALMRLYMKMIAVILLMCIIYVDIRCILWYFIRII